MPKVVSEERATVVLCAGEIDPLELPVNSTRNNAMVPIGGKPVISWLLDDLISKRVGPVVIVVRAVSGLGLRSFVERVYGRRLDVRVVALEHSDSIIRSLHAGLVASRSTGTTRVLLGDTLIRDPYDSPDDFLYVGRVESSRRWCIVVPDSQGFAVDYIHKRQLDRTSRLAAAGYYHFLDGGELLRSTEEAIEARERELSDVLRRYGARYPLRVREAREWHDFGHLDAIVESRHRLLRPRHFNSVDVDPLLKTITKTSDNDHKLRDELAWYLALPEELQILAPRILRHREIDGRLHVTQEYVGYPTLAELYLYGDLSLETWRSTLRYVLRIQRELTRFPGTLAQQSLRYMYDGKVAERLRDARSTTDPELHALLHANTVRLDGALLESYDLLAPRIEEEAARLAASATPSIVHGDLCFSNLLFDINNQILRLIDPRGSFGEPGIFGDPRYDIAKLRHSICSFYDFIVADMFSLELAEDGWHLEIFCSDAAAALAREFDEMSSEFGYTPREIRFIEGLLFLSMVPLHADAPDRQRVMYLTGLRLLNEVLAS